jgi:hypothetical protein
MPPIVVLSAAPIPTVVASAPEVRLNLPVPSVRSLITRIETILKIAFQSVQNLDRHRCYGNVSERVENTSNRKHAKSNR